MYMATLNKDGTPRKAGSGRTKGAKSLVSISLKELNQNFNEDDLIVCGSVFLRKTGLLDKSSPAIDSPLNETEKMGIQIIEV